ncbi:c-type cytochrome [Agaribacter marinus]|uniref:Cytochrome c n=1 Tax=Agaribacter marinus TaxID=1431249 RepID=A0AA37SVX3_9ALTE|nr:cytochrome c [Agaribacter marinus]GLR70588.1 cytochrome c [Agaribacter marinus]
MKKIGLSICCVLALSVSTFAHSDEHGVKSEKQAKTAIQFRKAVFQLIRSNMGPLGAMAKGNIPYDPALMEENGERMVQLGMMIGDYFHADTSSFKVPSDAKDSVWTNKADFIAKSEDFIAAAQNLQNVAAAKDEDNYRKAIGGVGGTCKACHDDYKKD